MRTSCRCVEKPNATLANQAYPALVTQENHYDPWGVTIEQEVVADKTKLPSFELRDRFTYNGKELQGTLNYLDYGARMYDTTIGRWGVVDPLADISRRFSPFIYGNNNALRFVDPDGMASEEVEDFAYSDGYSNLSSRNSIGSVGFSGAYNNSNQEENPPSLLQRLMDYFGFFKKPQSKEEARTYAERQKSLHELNEKLNKAREKTIEETADIPLLGQATKLSDAMMRKDATAVIKSSILFALDATSRGAEKEEKSFFAGTNYTDKVLGQMKNGDFHGFPENVRAFESSGVISTIKGGDGVTRQILKIPGEYGGKKGHFEFIKEANGTINHRLFRPNP